MLRLRIGCMGPATVFRESLTTRVPKKLFTPTLKPCSQLDGLGLYRRIGAGSLVTDEDVRVLATRERT